MVGGARKYIDAAMAPVLERLAAAEARADAAEGKIADMVAKAVAALPVAEKGDAGADGRNGDAGPQGRGVSKLLIDASGHLVATFTDGTTDDVGLVVGKDGRDGADGRDGVDGATGERGADGLNGKDGEPGKQGPAGKLPLVKAWLDTVHREGEVVTHEGGTYQAIRDTGKAPPHADWTCLAAPGRNGADGRSIVIRGTHSDDAEYSALDLVALNGGSFIAKRDDPGPCPGEGWQLLASQGKAGKPGDRGIPGPAGRGEPGFPVTSASIDGNGLLTLVNGDGSTVECDMYPVLSKLGGN